MCSYALLGTSPLWRGQGSHLAKPKLCAQQTLHRPPLGTTVLPLILTLGASRQWDPTAVVLLV